MNNKEKKYFKTYVSNLTICVCEQSNFATFQPSCSSVISSSAEMIFVEDLAVTSGGAIARREVTCPSLCSLPIDYSLINGYVICIGCNHVLQ